LGSDFFKRINSHNITRDQNIFPLLFVLSNIATDNLRNFLSQLLYFGAPQARRARYLYILFKILDKMGNRKLSWLVIIFGIIAFLFSFIILQQVIIVAISLSHIALGIFLLKSKRPNKLTKYGSIILILAPIISLLVLFLVGDIGGAILMIFTGGILYLLGFILTVIGLLK